MVSIYRLRLVLLLVTMMHLSAMVRPTAGHGLMCEPRQRGAYVSQKCGSNLPEPENPVIDYCAHCLNGGSKGVVEQNLPRSGWHLYDPIKDFGRTGTRAGLCGDAKGNNDHMIGGTFVPTSYGGAPIVAHWKTGSTVDFTAEIDTNHNGYFEFFLCDLDACGANDISGKCFTENHCHKLMRVKHDDCENPSPKTHTECGPIDEKYPGRWYVPCRKTDHVGIHIVGGSSGTMRYKLPDGVSCEHCVVQWYWATANSCAPRGFTDYMTRNGSPFGTTCPSDGGGLGAYNAMMVDCGGSTLPEEFWSCADVKISSTGGSAGGTAGSGEGGSNSGSSNGGADDSDDESDGSAENGNSNNGGGSGNQDNTDEGNNNDNNGDNSNTDNSDDNESGDNDGNESGSEGGNSNEDNGRKNSKCAREGKLCDENHRCCENEELVCVLLENETSPRCAVWWRLSDMASRYES